LAGVSLAIVALVFVLIVFMAFSFSHALNVSAFQAAARETALSYGASNTLILVTSSHTITLAIRAAAARDRPLAARLLAATGLLGAAFLVVKGFEYHDDLERHLYPGVDFALGQTAAMIFWSFYWIMTGVHAIHLAIGVGLVSRLAWLMERRRLSLPRRSSRSHRYIGTWSTPSGLCFFPFSMSRVEDERARSQRRLFATARSDDRLGALDLGASPHCSARALRCRGACGSTARSPSRP
jgi:heme/copper-type cytochrome/quinol oxidase subunit 3